MKDIATILNSGSITLCADDNSDVRTQGINVLGVPIGSSNYVKHYVQQKLIKANVVGTPFEKLSAQEKMHITCWSASAQFNHIMRTDTGKISDEMGYALESEILKLKTYFINATQPVEETTEPVEKSQEVDIYKYLINKL